MKVKLNRQDCSAIDRRVNIQSSGETEHAK